MGNILAKKAVILGIAFVALIIYGAWKIYKFRKNRNVVEIRVHR
jgi:hypothetical protein